MQTWPAPEKRTMEQASFCSSRFSVHPRIHPANASQVRSRSLNLRELFLVLGEVYALRGLLGRTPCLRSSLTCAIRSVR